MTDPQPDAWAASLDAVEARLVLQEAALAQGAVDGSFAAVVLPTAPPNERDRVRAQLALRRIRRLEQQMRGLQQRRPSPVRCSPYG